MWGVKEREELSSWVDRYGIIYEMGKTGEETLGTSTSSICEMPVGHRSGEICGGSWVWSSFCHFSHVSPPPCPNLGNHSLFLKHDAVSLTSVSLHRLLFPTWERPRLPFSQATHHLSVLVSGFRASGKPVWFHQAGSAHWTCAYVGTYHTVLDVCLHACQQTADTLSARNVSFAFLFPGSLAWLLALSSLSDVCWMKF